MAIHLQFSINMGYRVLKWWCCKNIFWNYGIWGHILIEDPKRCPHPKNYLWIAIPDGDIRDQSLIASQTNLQNLVQFLQLGTDSKLESFTVLSVRFEVGISFLLAPARADKRGPKASCPPVENAGIQPGFARKYVLPAGARVRARSYWKHWIYMGQYQTFFLYISAGNYNWERHVLQGPFFKDTLFENGAKSHNFTNLYFGDVTL